MRGNKCGNKIKLLLISLYESMCISESLCPHLYYIDNDVWIILSGLSYLDMCPVLNNNYVTSFSNYFVLLHRLIKFV